MVAPRTPNYRLNSVLVVKLTKPDSNVLLPEGTYIRPIELDYVPDHVRANFKYFHEPTEVFAYTKYGIIAIPRHMIEES